MNSPHIKTAKEIMSSFKTIQVGMAAACARARGAAQLEHAGARSAPCVHLVELELEVDPVVEVVPAAL